MNKVVRMFTFLRLIDQDGNLSITNILCMCVGGAVVYKTFATAPQPTDIAALLSVLTNYLGKKVILSNNQP